MAPTDGLRQGLTSAAPFDGLREWLDSSIVSNLGGGLGSRKSMKPPFCEEESVPLRSSSGAFAKRTHHELVRRIGWLCGGFGSRIEEGLGGCTAP